MTQQPIESLIIAIKLDGSIKVVAEEIKGCSILGETLFLSGRFYMIQYARTSQTEVHAFISDFRTDKIAAITPLVEDRIVMEPDHFNNYIINMGTCKIITGVTDQKSIDTFNDTITKINIGNNKPSIIVPSFNKHTPGGARSIQ